MTGVLVEIRQTKAVTQRKLALDTGTRDAVADLARERWPSNTAKLAAREWGLTLDQARSAVAGRASQTTIDQIIKAGGWPVLFAVGAKVTGQGADQFLSELRASHENHAERLSALLGGWGTDPPSRFPHPGSVDDRQAERRVFGRRGVG